MTRELTAAEARGETKLTWEVADRVVDAACKTPHRRLRCQAEGREVLEAIWSELHVHGYVVVKV